MGTKKALYWPLIAAGAIVALCASTHLFANTAREKSHNPPPANNPQRLRIEKQIRLTREADDVWQNRDKAEALLKEAIDLGGNPEFERLDLVRLYEEEGRPKDALAQYRLVLQNPLNAGTFQDHNWADYAALAQKCGTDEEAQSATLHYIEDCVMFGTGSPHVPQLNFESPEQLGEAADMVTAYHNDQMVRQIEQRQLPRLVEKYPDIAVGHLLLAREMASRLKNTEAEAELQKADDLAGPSLAEETSKLRQTISLLRR